jgi:hypothetical protein
MQIFILSPEIKKDKLPELGVKIKAFNLININQKKQKTMLVKIKETFVNKSKIQMVSFATSEKNKKNYLIIEMDSLNSEQTKKFIEVSGIEEFNFIINQLKADFQ